MSRPFDLLTPRAQAVVRWLGSRVIDAHVLESEFIDRRGWYPEDFYKARWEAIEAGVVVVADGMVRRGGS